MSPRITGRLVGAFVLSAFVLYGVGSALAGRAAGTVLVALNCVVVAAIGVLVFRVLRRSHPGTAGAYLVARGMEALLLAVGIVVAARVGAGAADAAYQAAMLSLGLGSLPFCLALNRLRWLPTWLAFWGVGGYALLAAGAVAELAGIAVGLAPAVPGGLFEVVFGVLLLARGFAPPAAAPVIVRPGLAPGPATVDPSGERR